MATEALRVLAFAELGDDVLDAGAGFDAVAGRVRLMTGMVIIGLVKRPRGRTLRVLCWVGVGREAAYLVNVARVFFGGL